MERLNDIVISSTKKDITQNLDTILGELKSLSERELSEVKARLLESEWKGKTAFKYEKIVGKSEAMRRVLNKLDKVTNTMVPTFICGESGTGKELIARALHENSQRSRGPFIPVNCGAIPENLMESEFFGYEKGAFTGATRDTLGLFEQSHGGTLFLDEVGEMPANLQAKLLRVIQEKRVRHLGGQTEIPVDVRLIAASNKDLKLLVQKRTFREDLFYRLAALTIEIPPLRARREDIPLLADHFLKKFAEQHQFPKTPAVSRKAMKKLMEHRWPGNIRELEHVLTNACLLRERDKIDEGDIHFLGTLGPDNEALGVRISCAFDESKVWEDYETDLLRQIVAKFNGNKSHAAKALQLSRTTLIKKIGDTNCS